MFIYGTKGGYKGEEIFIYKLFTYYKNRRNIFNKILLKMSTIPTKLIQDSATLIILARNNNNNDQLRNNGFNYKILSLKRSEKTSFLANHIVFAGGACELTDQSKEWIEYFKKSGINENYLNEITKTNRMNRPQIFKKQNDYEIDREISLRITAIRETFEELGVLFCRKRNDIEKNDNNGFGKFFEDYTELKLWQELVHNDSKKFLELCKKFEVIPDLWSLYEWSAWITPPTYKRRFETAFFLVTLNKMPEIIPEPHEVQEYMWKDPTEYLQLYKNEDIFLPPPQFYEFSRLTKYHDITELTKFAKNRNTEGVTLLLGVQYRCKNGVVFVLPGDDAYPENPHDIIHEIDDYSEQTVEEFRQNTKNLHRSEHKSIFNVKCYLNFKPFNGHISPVLEENEFKNKL